MGARILFVLIFMAVGALAYGWWNNHQHISTVHQAQVEKFINAGPRFTAQDGQELCERVKALEASAYSSTGRKPMDCNYLRIHEAHD